MIDQDRAKVHCNNLNCTKMLHVPLTAREPTATRFHVWNNGWYIDLNSDREAILTSLNIDTPDDLRNYCHGGRFNPSFDQHYCSIECVTEDT